MTAERGERHTSQPLPAIDGFVVSLLSADDRMRVLSVDVATDAPRFEGHFPGEPVLPAVSQLCDLVVPYARSAWPELGLLAGAPRLKFPSRVAPGDRLTMKIERAPGERRVRFELSGPSGPCAVGTLEFS